MGTAATTDVTGDGSKGVTGGVIAGIVVGALAGFLLAAAFIGEAVVLFLCPSCMEARSAKLDQGGTALPLHLTDMMLACPQWL